MAGLWSNSESPRLPDEEEIGGEMNLVGPGGSSGYGVDEDTGLFGPGKSSGTWLVLEGHLGMVLMKTLVCSDLEGHQVLDKLMTT